MNIGDDLYLGGFIGGGIDGITLGATGSGNPTLNQGIGPAGRIFYHNITPVAPSATNLAALQAPTGGVALTLTAGAGVTRIVNGAPDGSGSTIYQFDVPRCPQLTSGANLSGINFTAVGYDVYKRLTTSTRAGPNGNTVVFAKSMMSIVSITPAGTSASTVSAGGSNTYGMPVLVKNGAYIGNLGWVLTTGGGSGANQQNSFADDTGTFLSGDQTSPATALTGDPRGTYAPSSNADAGHQLLISVHLDGTQCGANALLVNAIGVTPV